MKTLIKTLVIVTTLLALASISFAGGKGDGKSGKGSSTTKEAGAGSPGI